MVMCGSLVWGMTGPAAIHAQTVEILAADQIARDPSITEAQRLLGNVKLGHQDAVLTCDSAWRFDNGNVKVFGHVHMDQPPATTMDAEYLFMDAASEWTVAEGQVRMDHEGTVLEAPSIRYHVGNRRAKYLQGASIDDGEWTLSSLHGAYDAETERLELGTEVLAIRDADTLRSDSLHWWREAGRYRFFGPTSWRSPDLAFDCQTGDVDMPSTEASEAQPEGWMAGDVHVQDGSEHVRGDSLAWNEEAHEVWGHVMLWSDDGLNEVHGHHALETTLDSAQSVQGLPSQLAWLRQIDGEDTLHVAGMDLHRRHGVLTVVDSVNILSGELMGQGDSLVWWAKDSVLQVWGQPQLWAGGDRLSGDSLRLLMRNQRPDMLEMRGHSVVLSPANDSLAHRIQGRDLDAHFVDGALTTVEVLGNGELTYFEGAAEGSSTLRMNQALCAEVTLALVDEKLSGLTLHNSPKGTLRPLVGGMDLAPFQLPLRPEWNLWETSEQRGPAD